MCWWWQCWRARVIGKGGLWRLRQLSLSTPLPATPWRRYRGRSRWCATRSPIRRSPVERLCRAGEQHHRGYPQQRRHPEPECPSPLCWASLLPPWAPVRRWSFWPAALCCGPRRTCTSAHRQSFLITCGLIAFFLPASGGSGGQHPLSAACCPACRASGTSCTGAVLFCAVFLLNEPTPVPTTGLTYPVTAPRWVLPPWASAIFGVYETGVCFALLAVNSVSALIDRIESGCTVCCTVCRPERKRGCGMKKAYCGTDF